MYSAELISLRSVDKPFVVRGKLSGRTLRDLKRGFYKLGLVTRLAYEAFNEILCF